VRRHQAKSQQAEGTTVFDNSQRAEWSPRQGPRRKPNTPGRRHWASLAAVIGVAGAVIAVLVAFLPQHAERPAQVVRPHPPRAREALPNRPGYYIGVYRTGVPASYSGVTAFTTKTGIRPRLVVYYSGWFEPFKANFATTVSKHGAVPLVQINPTGISLAAIASGRYDGYLSSYAAAVRAYHRPVILSFGHEMNGNWYSWGYQHTSPAVFVAAWRHIVTLFRSLRARNVTWLWTANIMHRGRNIPDPAPWWPGRSYVTWVGLDGYYYSPSWKFAPLFGPTIAAVRELTRDPILIAETSAATTTDQPAKIADLFAGIRLYGLLGFVWFDSVHTKDWRLNDPAAIAAFRQGAKAYYRPAS
jgi:mannan endo-1,4-beta-mannosidase